ncbi:uncharacterized protein LOC130590220 [Beta vulgaris subsp. vulgaris]|uniref:uncharacterized protein LOC130590220 n=1 Tax=Beta vulgaris subsp. vulgaris TaxID=3555 RepID=UPI0025494461|nr:uncharacterized protein LOC130590220 [Beta vulgaris subsp. vulgaris]
MAKGSKKGNGGKKKNQSSKTQKNKRKPQSGDARKMKNVNEINDVAALSWTSEEENDLESHNSVDLEASNMDRANFEAARDHVASWVTSIRTPLRQSVPQLVNPSPHPMQQLQSNPGNTNWRTSLFESIQEEGIDLSNAGNVNNDVEQNMRVEDDNRFAPIAETHNVNPNVIKITDEDVKSEIDFWNSAVVCYVLGIKLPFRIVEGFIRRIWGKFGVERVVMKVNGVFIVRFRTGEGKQKAMDAGPILYDKKPVIVKNWSPELDLSKDMVHVVPTWIQLQGLNLKYWGPRALNKIVGVIGKPIRTDRATAQKDSIEFARVLVEVRIDQDFPNEIRFENENGVEIVQGVKYECKPIFCKDCGGIGHTLEECRAKKQEIQRRMSKPKQVWVRKESGLGAGNNQHLTTDAGNLNEDNDKGTSVVQGQLATTATNQLHKEQVQPVVQDNNNEEGGCTAGDAGKELNWLFGFLETRVKAVNFDKVFPKICKDWSIVTNYSHHLGGRIWLAWIPSLFVVDIRCIGDQYVHCEVLHRASGSFFWLTIVYGLNDRAERKRLWSKLCQISSNLQGAWIVMGDYNNVLNLEDRIGSAVTLDEVGEFRQCVRDCKLMEMQMSGPFFTWSNKQEGEHRVFSKIDRVFVNDIWMDKFVNCCAEFLPEGISDHCPCVLKLVKHVVTKPKSFRFYNMWMEAPEFMNMVTEVWNSPVNGVAMYQVVTKLKKLKPVLKLLNKSKFSDIENEAAAALVKLMEVQQKIQNDPRNSELHREEEENRMKYAFLNKAKLSFLHQKVKSDWLKGGDDNTAYFHACLRKRRIQNHISRIQDSQGVWQETPEQIEEAFIGYYKVLLGTEEGRSKGVSRTIVNEGPLLTHDQKSSLCLPFSGEDVKKALFDIEDNKAAGPDGFSSGFFKKTWEITGPDIIKAVLDFFSTGKLLKQVNATNLCLIPKCEQAEDVTKYRPIACCNVLYKIISKLMCQRLKVVLPFIINPVQSAFVESRVIMHNIFLCQDLMKQYKRKNGPARCTIKVDLRKAYDSLNWDFIKDLLVALNFPDKFLHWVMVCITTPCFSLSFNGVMSGFFKGEKGIRQGDPISPLLFVIAMEYLSRILKRMSRKDGFEYHNRCGPLQLTHLVFADDLMMFCKGQVSSVLLMSRAMKAFQDASGLSASKEKTAVYFGNVTDEVQARIVQATGFQKGTFPFRYLGIPMTSKRITKADCDLLTDRMLKRILCWSSRNLSYAARICRAFLWEGKDVLHKTPPVAWADLCKPKKIGGLGIRDCIQWNVAAMGKYVWQVSEKEDLLWIKWVHSVYIKQADWWEYSAPTTASWGWKVICKAKEKFKLAYNNNKWLDEDGVYTIKDGYKWLMGDIPKVRWHYWVWNSYNIPKHSFIGWLAALGKLKTKDKLFQVGVCADQDCLLCIQGQDSCSHLFFYCQYSKKVCTQILEWLGLESHQQENLYVRWKKWGRKYNSTVKKKFCYATLAATVYYIWYARNTAHWKQMVIHPDQIVRSVKKDVYSRVALLQKDNWKTADKEWVDARSN